jgi:type II secretory pathway pseudopilin PulG
MINKRGQSMFELLVAVFVIAISLVAILGLVTGAIGNTTFSKERTQANKFTQEAAEWLRSERDTNWLTFKGKGDADGNKYCLPDLMYWPTATTGTCGATIPNTNFTREAILIYNSSDPDIVEARIITSWTDSSGKHDSTVVTYFTNWRTR